MINLNNASLLDKIESVQYNAVLTITKNIRELSSLTSLL